MEGVVLVHVVHFYEKSWLVVLLQMSIPIHTYIHTYILYSQIADKSLGASSEAGSTCRVDCVFCLLGSLFVVGIDVVFSYHVMYHTLPLATHSYEK